MTVKTNIALSGSAREAMTRLQEERQLPLDEAVNWALSTAIFVSQRLAEGKTFLVETPGEERLKEIEWR
jgi:hypothetical protein